MAANLIKAGMGKSASMLVCEKKALQPCSLEESRRSRSQHPDRCLPARVVITVKVEDAGQEYVQARMAGRSAMAQTSSR